MESIKTDTIPYLGGIQAGRCPEALPVNTFGQNVMVETEEIFD